MVWYSGADVARHDWERGDWTMRLPMGVARLDRLKSGAPLVKDHTYDRSVDTVLGSFTEAWIEGGKGMGRVKWSDTEDALAVKRLVQSGILRFVSMELQIDDFRNVTPAGGKKPIFEATGWEPMCVAVVAVQADPGSQFMGSDHISPMPACVDDGKLALASVLARIHNRAGAVAPHGGSVNKQQLLARQAELRALLESKLAEFQALAANKPPTEDDDGKVELEGIQAKLASIARLEAETIEAAKRRPAGTAGRVEDNGEKNPWGGLGEFLSAIATSHTPGNTRDPRLYKLAASGAYEGVPADGGYLVGTEFSSDLFKRTYEKSALASRCNNVPIGAPNGMYSRPYVDETSRADGSRFGGVRVYRAAEADTVTATKPKFGRLELKLEKLMGLAYATEENLADAAQLGAIFSEAFTNEMAFKLDTEIFEGSGVGECLGIKTSPSKVSVAKETSQVAATVYAANIDKMWARMWAPSRKSAIWVVNQDLEPQLSAMFYAVKNVAGTENVGGFPVYMPNNGLSDSPYATLRGRPVIPIEQCATLGTQGDIALIDLSQYMLISKGGIQADSSMHVRFLYDEMTFRWTWRINGAPIWKAALTPKNGTNTLSPFVFLDTRA